MKKRFLAFLILGILITGSTSVAVYAHKGSDDSDNTSEDRDSDDSDKKERSDSSGSGRRSDAERQKREETKRSEIKSHDSDDDDETSTERHHARHNSDDDEKDSEDDDSDAKPEKKAVATIKRERLSEKRKQRCESRETKINDMMQQARTRSDVRYERLSKIFTMVKTYYAEQKLSIENYDQLVAAVDQAKASAEQKKAELTQVPKFDCSSDGPKADLSEFISARKEKIAAYKTYREALCSLTNAVLEATKQQVSEETQQ